MACSMTGFGRAQGSTGRYAVDIEIRSLNNRYLKVRLRVPSAISNFEAQIENLVRSRLSRGTVDMWVRITDLAPASGYTLDMDMVRRYREFASTLQAEMDIHGDLGLSDYIMLPGVISTGGDDSGAPEDLLAVVMDLAGKAIGSLEEMRMREGRALALDIAKRADIIGALAKEISALTGEVVAAYRDRLLSRVRDLMAGSGIEISEENILREVSIFAERSDISEELARIESHLQQLREALESDGDQGRKLEFVAQELHREINTIGSKANDAAISRLVVDAKGEIDKIREQCQNLE